MLEGRGPQIAGTPGSRQLSLRAQRMLCGAWCQWADVAAFAAAFFGIAVSPFARSAHSLRELLEVRVSLRDVVVGMLCLATWRALLVSVGMYRVTRRRTLINYVFRCLIGLNSCAAVVGLVETVMHPAGSAWHVVEVFWIAGLLTMPLVRAAGLLARRPEAMADYQRMRSYHRTTGSRLE